MAFSRIPPSGNAVPLSRFFAAHAADFEKVFSAHCGFSKENILCADSGTAALYLALLALKRLHPARRDVILPAWCCPSVPQAVLQAGLRPVQVDLDPATFAYPPQELAAAVSKTTLTILLVHYFGIHQPKPVLDNPPPLFLRDCAQDFDFKNAGENDCVVFYSFGRGKSLNVGHGGALCLPEHSALRTAVLETLETFPKASRSPRFKALLIHLFSHPAAFGLLSSLPFLSIGKTVWEHPLHFNRIHPEFFKWGSVCIAALESHRDAYAALMEQYIQSLSGFPKISIPCTAYDRNHLPIRFPILVSDPVLREKLRDRLNKKFGGVAGQYPDILSRLPGVPDEFPKDGSFPGCEQIAREILTLPVTAWLAGKENAFIEKLDAMNQG